jgi:hypothetical protein
MRLQKHRRENKTRISLDVRKIEVTRLTWELDENGLYETYHRTFRFTIPGGEAFEVVCSAKFEGEIKLRSVKKLPAVQEPINLASGDWLQPKVYKGKSMHQEELERLGKK